MGDEDHMFLPSVTGLVRRHTRFSKLEVLPECGHVVNVDRPELFNLLSIDFIRAATPA
jgi:pimeloyl-ACP methyl ester carboxylesterase